MQIRACCIAADGSLKPVELDEALALPRSCDYWIDVGEPRPEAIRTILESLGVPDALDEALAGRRRSFVHTRGSIIVNFTALTDAHDRTRSIAFVCLPDVLVSLHEEPSASVEQTLERLGAPLLLESPTKTDLLRAIMAALFRENLDEGFAIRDHAMELLGLLDENSRAVPMDDIVGLKRRFGQFSATCEDQLYAALSFRRNHPHVFRREEEAKVFSSIADIHVHFTIDFLRLLEARVTLLHQQAMTRLQESVNARLRLLTAVSTVLLPLSLITGIYGMNFDVMPELQWRFGYPAVLIVMLCLGTGTIVYLQRRGWFR
jgi:magnesium transporter